MQASMKNTAATMSGVQQDTFLPPIHRPKSLIMRLVFYFTRRQYGKVLTPLSVFAARLPLAFGMLYGKVGSLDKKLRLHRETVLLVRILVARINVCLFCIDASRSFAIAESFDEAKFDALDDYHTSPLFSDAERAALDYATELTRNKRINQSTFDRLSNFYSDREICELVWLVASEHIYNVTNIGLNIHSDMICDIARKRTL